MNIVKIIGGLGNQMLQYALYVSMRERGIECKMDVTNLNKYLAGYNRDSIFNCFNVKEDFASAKDVKILGDEGIDVISKVKRRLNIYKKTHFIQKKSRVYYDGIYNMENTYFDGYWFNYKYFYKYIDILNRDFTLKRDMSNDNLSLANEILTKNNSISIHVRLGDYVNVSKVSGICTEKYYKDAINYFLSKFDNCYFYIFSDEPEKVKERFHINNSTFVNINDEFNGCYDMQLMKLCKHNIVAHSTFSFWGAILNDNPKKIVIAPKKWSNDENENDNCPSEWIRLDG